MSSKTRGIVAYLALSFGGTWLWLFVAHQVMGLSALNPLLQLPAFCVPAIAALVVRRWVTREGFVDAGLRLRLKTAWRYYLLAWLGPLVIAAVTMALAAALGWWRPISPRWTRSRTVSRAGLRYWPSCSRFRSSPRCTGARSSAGPAISDRGFSTAEWRRR